MNEWATTTTILEHLKGYENHEAWFHLVECHRPTIVRASRKLGLSQDDAEDIAQATFIEFAKEYGAGTYERDKGSLRSWIRGIANNQIKAKRRENARRGERMEKRQPDDIVEALDASAWRETWDRCLLEDCLLFAKKSVEPKTYAVFEAVALKETPVAEVARRFNTTKNAVYVAKHRVLETMRMHRDALEQAPAR